MLLKIITNTSTKIITDIKDVEVLTGEFTALTWADVYDFSRIGAPPIRHNSESVVENYDWKPHCAEEPISSINSFINPSICDSPAEAYPSCVKYIDILKDGAWKRIAILNYAYLCNDEGKTIQKIG